MPKIPAIPKGGSQRLRGRRGKAVVVSEARKAALDVARAMGAKSARVCRALEALTLAQAHGDVELAFGSLQWHKWRDALDSWRTMAPDRRPSSALDSTSQRLTHLVLEQTAVIARMERELQSTEDHGPVTAAPIRVPILMDAFSQSARAEGDRLVRQRIIPFVRDDTLVTPSASDGEQPATEPLTA